MSVQAMFTCWLQYTARNQEQGGINILFVILQREDGAFFVPISQEQGGIIINILFVTLQGEQREAFFVSISQSINQPASLSISQPVYQ